MSSERQTGAAIADPEGDTPRSGAAVSVALFAGFDCDGRFQLEESGGQERVVALSTIALTDDDIGAPVVVARESAGDRRPIIIGRAHARRDRSATTARLDGDRVVIGADREIELRCGDASIILTRAGKVLIRGTYVVSRSRGANKIKGAFVDIN